MTEFCFPVKHNILRDLGQLKCVIYHDWILFSCETQCEQQLPSQLRPELHTLDTKEGKDTDNEFYIIEATLQSTLALQTPRYYASVNSSFAQTPLPRTDPQAIAFVCLGWQIPGGGDSWAVKSPGVGTKKEGKCPVLR